MRDIKKRSSSGLSADLLDSLQVPSPPAFSARKRASNGLQQSDGNRQTLDRLAVLHAAIQRRRGGIRTWLLPEEPQAPDAEQTAWRSAASYFAGGILAFQGFKWGAALGAGIGSVLMSGAGALPGLLIGGVLGGALLYPIGTQLGAAAYDLIDAHHGKLYASAARLFRR